MPDTPRTDELFDACGDSGCGREQTIGAAVGLARQLERDLTAARAEVVRLRKLMTSLCDRLAIFGHAAKIGAPLWPEYQECRAALSGAKAEAVT